MAKRVETKEVIVKYKADTSDFTKALKSLDKSAAQSARSLKNMERGFNTLFRTLRNVTVLYYMGRNLIDLGKAFTDAVDSIKAFRLQANALSGSTAGFDAMIEAAQNARISLEDMAKMTNIFTPALKKMGVSFQGSLGFIQNLTKSMRLFGVQGEAARNSTIQLAQAFSSGRLQGDELRSISENAGGLYAKLEDVIQGMLNTETGLRDLGTEGAITSDILFEAFNKLFLDIQDGFADLPKTVAQTTSVMSTEFKLLASAINEDFQVNETVVAAIEFIAEAVKSARVAMGEYAGLNIKEVLAAEAEVSEELKVAQEDLVDAKKELRDATIDSLNSIVDFGFTVRATKENVAFLEKQVEELSIRKKELTEKSKDAAAALLDTGDAVASTGAAMQEAAFDAEAFAKALQNMSDDAATATSELLALRAGGLAALKMQRQFNAEAAVFEKYADAPAEELNVLLSKATAGALNKDLLKQEEAAAKAVERARARGAARSGGGGGGSGGGGGGGGGASDAQRQAEADERRLQNILDKADPVSRLIRTLNEDLVFLGEQLGTDSEKFQEISVAMGEDFVDAIDRVQAKDLPKTLEDQVNVMGELYDIMAKDLSGSFIDLAYGTKSWADSILDLESSLLKAITQLLVIKPLMAAIEGGLSSAFPGLGIGTTAARAIGGPVVGGQAYMVGESGPEMFIPRSSGKIEPNGVAKSEVNVAVNFNGSVTGEGLRQSAAQIGAQVAAQTQRALARNS